MPQGSTISFVVFPDGSLDEASLTVCGKQIAQERCIAGWLPERFFGNPTGYIASTVWKGMREKGFKSYSIFIESDGTPKLAND